jgi:hypothetical protein
MPSTAEILRLSRRPDGDQTPTGGRTGRRQDSGALDARARLRLNQAEAGFSQAEIEQLRAAALSAEKAGCSGAAGR